MFNSRFVLSDGRDVYPNYMDTEGRRQLKSEIGMQREIMRCACRSDVKLYYLISENLAFYPEHKGYEHAPHCVRYRVKDKARLTAFVPSDNDCNAVLYLKFNANNFTVPSNSKDEDESSESDSDEAVTQGNVEDLSELASEPENELLYIKKEKATVKEKEPEFDLIDLIKAVNYDTFTERAILNKSILTSEYFTNALFGRLKYLKIHGFKKPIRELSLDEDGIRFFYAPFAGCEVVKREGYTSCNIVVRGKNDTKYSMFTFNAIYEKALNDFVKRYGIEPDEHTMISGFQYYRKSKRGAYYKVVGRMHLFQVSNNGLYCRTIHEMYCYNAIISFVKSANIPGLKFYIPIEDDVINGIFEVVGKEKKGLIIFPATKKNKELPISNTYFEYLVLERDQPITRALLIGLIEKL